MTRGIFETWLPASPAAVFSFHERPDAVRLLTPWWSGLRIERPAASLRPGQRARFVLGFGPFRVEWEAEHDLYDPPRHFEDHQVRGPFERWRHRHLVIPDGDGARLRDVIEYRLPGGPLAPLLDRCLVRPFLTRLFRYRHAATRRALADR